jgi:hypothetical protein
MTRVFNTSYNRALPWPKEMRKRRGEGWLGDDE